MICGLVKLAAARSVCAVRVGCRRSPVVVSVDDARHGARSFVLAALRALHIAPLLVAVLIGYYPGAGLGERSAGRVRAARARHRAIAGDDRGVVIR